MKQGLVWLAALSGCYQPQLTPGAPCSASGACPGAQQCDIARTPPTCVDHLVDASPPDTATAADAAAPLGPWGAPVQLSFTVAGMDDDPTLTGDMLELVFNRAGDLYVTTRASLADPWADPVPITELNTGVNESTPDLSLDGLTLFFSSNRPGGTGGVDVWMSTRPARTSPWGTPVDVPSLSSKATDRCAAPTGDPDVIVLASNRLPALSFDLFWSMRAGTDWTTPVLIPNVNSGTQDTAPFLSADGLTLYFFSDRGSGTHLYQAVRASPTAMFDAPTEITELSVAGAADTDPWVSPDSRHLFFARDSALYEATR